MTHLIKRVAQAITPFSGRSRQGQGSEPELLPIDEKHEEETLEDYRPDRFYPAKYHEMIGDRYEILVKFGYGGYSTVWLAKDLRTKGFVTLKILTNDYNDDTVFSCERKMLQHITATDPNHPGYQLVRTLLDSFDISGPNGKHTCLVHEPLGIDMLKFHNKWLGRRQLPPYLIKSVTRRMLSALNYLHTACRVVHTDIKPNNILIQIRTKSLKDFVRQEAANPGPRKVLPDRIIYESRSSFGPHAHGGAILTDFGLAKFGDVDHEEEIQPDEVWYLFEDDFLMPGKDGDGEYDAKIQLAQMIAYLGPPPIELLERGKKSHKAFDTEGKSPSLVLFLQFMRSMLEWLPEKRKTAKELLSDEWLNSQDAV
ncbi:hypothetical protein P7C71_g4219, partial [Lecanoromycetidae sp. Uapishka_2]